jgi:prepilin-type N-terminal cleavage/methylation domain-containing protein
MKNILKHHSASQRWHAPTPVTTLRSVAQEYVLIIVNSLKKILHAYVPMTSQVTQCRDRCGGFTLIETLVAVTLLVVAISGPMSLASQSLSAAFYARDQMTAFHLAQEAVEAVRSVRDGNILLNASGVPTNLWSGIPDITGKPFTVDIRFNDPDESMQLCSGVCSPLKHNDVLYGYGTDSSWKETRFTRIVTVRIVGDGIDEIKVSVEVRWRSGAFQERSFTMSENLYRWVPDDTVQ